MAKASFKIEPLPSPDLIRKIKEASSQSIRTACEHHAAALDPQHGQITACVGTGVDIDAIFPLLRLADRGMTMNDKLTEIRVAI